MWDWSQPIGELEMIPDVEPTISVVLVSTNVSRLKW